MSKTHMTFATVCAAIFFASPLFATQFRGGESVVVAKSDSVTDDLFLSCGNAKISGSVTGDLMGFGGSLVFEGPVKGSVMAAGRSVELSGPITGSVRVAGQNLVVNTHVVRNLMAAGQTIHLGSETKIAGDAHLAGEEILIDGQVLGNLYASGARVVILGHIGKNVSLKAEKITLMPTAVIEGNLKYRSRKEAKVEKGALVKGEIKWLPLKRKAPKPFLTAGKVFGKLFFYVAMLIVGSLIIALFRKQTYAVKELALTSFLKSFGIGLLGLVAALVGGLLCLVTLIGAPLALITFTLTFLTVYTTKIFISIAVGDWVLKLFQKTGSPSPYWALVVGLFLVTILVSLPYVGWLFYFVVLFTGFGAILLSLKPLIPQKMG